MRKEQRTGGWRGVMIAAAALVAVTGLNGVANAAEKLWVTYEGGDGPGKGKHVVLISGDEEYRSEEALAQLGKILATHHGFKCTVLFAIDPATGVIDSNNQKNIPGLHHLEGADLMVIATRFRNPPDEDMKHVDAYLKRGGPVVGMRTATHAFKMDKDSAYSHYSFNYGGDKSEWKQGFGRLVLGETWISHHGTHKGESTLGFIAPDAKDHPITRGIADGDIWGPTDVYGVRLPLPGDSKHIILGQVTKRDGPKTDDPFFGMKPTDKTPSDNAKKNDPMMPVAWTKTYQVPGGETGRVFTTTMGSSTDLVSEGTRRMIVNGVYWAVGMEDKIPQSGTKVDIVGEFNPSAYGFHRGDYWPKKGLRPSDFEMK